MKLAYVDTSCLLAVAFDEPGANRPLTKEFDRITSEGYLKGADLWHLACALFLAPAQGQLAFLTLDRRQKEAAAKLGFPS